MSNTWWSCKTCGGESYNSRDAYLHTIQTGHDGNGLVTTECGTGAGSTDEGRRRARELYEQARREAKQ